MRIQKNVSLLVLLALTAVLFMSGVADFQSVAGVFSENMSAFLKMLIIFAGCIIIAPLPAALLCSGSKFWRGLWYLLAGLAASGAALFMLFTIKFATDASAAVVIAVFVSVLIISTAFIISDVRVHKKTIDRLEERGVRASVIKRKTAIKNFYALIFENSGRVASVTVALYLIGDTMVLGGELGCRFVQSADILSYVLAVLCAVAVTALIGNIIALWIER